MPEFVENDAELTLSLEGSPTSATANNLTTTVEGYALDARQGYVLDNKKLDKSNVANNLNTIEEGKALDARQGKWLDENKVGYSAIANDLNTDDVKKVLSAAQGKVLSDKVKSVEKAIDELPEIPEVTPESIGAVTMKSAMVSLPVSGWKNKTQTVTVSGIATSDKTQFVTPEPESWQHAKDCGVYVSAYAANSITFACETTPTAALTMGVAIFA